MDFPDMRRFPAWLLVLFVSVSIVHAQSLAPAPSLHARSAILLDFESGAVLLEQDADIAIPPASMTKLMTLHLAYEDIRAGKADGNDIVTIGGHDWLNSLPAAATRIYLAPGHQISVQELMQATAIPSANDAALVLAHHLGGTLDAFVERMNTEAAALGLANTRFFDPTGISSQNTTTARDFAAFSRAYVAAHPESLAELHSCQSIDYPRPRNVPGATPASVRGATFYNHNLLLAKYPGVDGLKTGYIRKSGYNLAFTAQRNGRRLIAVVMGISAKSLEAGQQKVYEDGKALLDYGFAVLETQQYQ